MWLRPISNAASWLNKICTNSENVFVALVSVGGGGGGGVAALSAGATAAAAGSSSYCSARLESSWPSVALNGLVSGGERWQRLLKVTPPHSTLHRKVPLVHKVLTELYLSTRLQVPRPVT